MRCIEGPIASVQQCQGGLPFLETYFNTIVCSVTLSLVGGSLFPVLQTTKSVECMAYIDMNSWGKRDSILPPNQASSACAKAPFPKTQV